ncbi:MAG: hypothetical protein NTX97_10465, partial [Bacteroidetes bacterium]|nr:hypothetical protein [Bacteroidota bacterium]
MEEKKSHIENEKIELGSEKDFSFRKYAWRQFKKNKLAYYSFRILIFLIILAVISPVIATDEPLYCKYKGVNMFPALSFNNTCEIKNVDGSSEKIQYDITDWKRLDATTIIFAPVAYAANKTDYDNADYVSPGGGQVFKDKEGKLLKMPIKFRHWLGTGKAGEDVLSGLINGTRISLSIGILSMVIASFLGILLGALAGYFGDHKLQTTRGSFWTMAI